jgi:hypothetical protein
MYDRQRAAIYLRSYRAEGYGRISLLLLLTHYMLYLDIKISEETCITSYYCDNQSLLKNEEKIPHSGY